MKHLLRRSTVLYNGAATAVTVGRFLRHRPHEIDFELFRGLARPVCFVDIGANRGQSALSFASVSKLPHRIVSFEANTRNEPYLRLTRRLLGRRYEYHLCGLGRAASTEAFYVPVQGRRRITGEGSFNRAAVEEAAPRIDGAYRIERETFEIRRFDSFDLRPDIVKIDVQGLELDVLVGMGTALDAAPLLMVEASVDNDAGIEEYLSRFGYAPLRPVGPPWRLSRAPQRERPLNWFYAADATVRLLPELFDAERP